MNDHPLLGQFAQLTSAFIHAKNQSPSELQTLQTNLASALLQQQPHEQLTDEFEFEKIQDVHMQNLEKQDLLHLNEVLQNASDPTGQQVSMRAFRREVPFITSQVKGSVPNWARGAKIAQTIGPLIDVQGRRFWWDFYYIVPGVKLFLQDVAKPALLLSVKESWVYALFNSDRDHNIPACTVWINAHLLSSAAPDNQYCGLKVKDGHVHFSTNVHLDKDIMIVPHGTTVTITLHLVQQNDTSVSPDTTGIDAKNSTIKLPDVFTFSFTHSSTHILSAGDASWTIYNQSNDFTFDVHQLPFYLPQLNRIGIPYTSRQAEFEVIDCQSKTFNIRASAPITKAAWGLSCAVMDVNNPLEADGTGGMMLQTGKGLSASWTGLLDVNLQDKEWIKLRTPWILLQPGRISITDLHAGNIQAKQQYKLWKNTKQLWNTIDLQYTNSFLFFYNCIQSGNEAVMAITNCTGVIDKPVNVAGVPFELKSKQTVFLLNVSKAASAVFLYDDDLLIDNNSSSPYLKLVTFKSSAIALNNALLTISPITGFLLAGELKNEQEFDKAILIYSFGLLGYLPTLPDPYAADLDVFKNSYRLYDSYQKEGGIPVTAIRQLLVANMLWKNDVSPEVNFIWGSIGASVNSDPSSQNAVQSPGVSINLLSNQDLAYNHTRQSATRQQQHLERQYQAAGAIDHPVAEMAMNAVRGNDRFQNSNLFSLLDVSTNADLFGVNIGFINEQFIFGKTFHVEPIDPTKNPLAIRGMDVVAASRFVRIFTVPQISWEPVLNITPAFNATKDPPYGILKYDNDGIPALIGNTGHHAVPLAPLPVTAEVITNYNTSPDFKAWSLFTLPNGMTALARYNQDNYYVTHPNKEGAKLALIKAAFKDGIQAGLQIVSRSGKNPGEDNHVFEGLTLQGFNVKSLFTPGNWSILGKTVTEIFNNEFAGGTPRVRGVPLERYDFSGYGANVFSNWLNKGAEIAAVSKAIFDVWKGRVAKEVIEVRTILYPWAVRVVRTITLYRTSTAFEYRVDSGWRADSDGEYEFRNRYPAKDAGGNVLTNADGSFQFLETPDKYVFHPGLVRGVYNVRNIVENDLLPFKKKWTKTSGIYVNENDGQAYDVHDPVHPLTEPLYVELVPVYFDADVFIHDVDGTPKDGKGIPKGQNIPSRKMLGYLQVAPRGVMISKEDFAELIDTQRGLGGPVDTLLNVNGSGQKMRVSRVEVNHSIDESNQLVFVSAAMGMPVLAKDGSWSLVAHNKTSKEVHPITETVVSLLRKGILKSDTEENLNNLYPKEIVITSELFKAATSRLTQLGFLQNTDTQKVLYRNPFFKAGEDLLHSTMPDLGDAYRLLNSKGVFPNLDNLPTIDLDARGCATKIIEQGYQMVDKAATSVLKSLEQDFSPGASLTFIDSPGVLKVYVEYAKVDNKGVPGAAGKLKFDLNSLANKWVNKMDDITMVVDLVGKTRIFMITGKFDTAKGKAPEFLGPKLIPGKFLEPIIKILEVLEVIGSSGDYAEVVKKSLRIAMSNSPNNWEYKLHADKEIPVLQFPAAYLDGPTTPLRLEANMKLGVYFNLAVPNPPDGLPGMSAGAFIEFGAKLSVMCVSLAAATVYAVGQLTLRISGDTVKGPSLYLKMGFGIELMVGLPVVGNVSVLYAVGIEMTLDKTEITVAAFILFRGRAELLGGIVTITIQIEASGKIHRTLGSPNRTDCIAQVTFSIDVSVLFVIDIHHTESWQEARQIA